SPLRTCKLWTIHSGCSRDLHDFCRIGTKRRNISLNGLDIYSGQEIKKNGSRSCVPRRVSGRIAYSRPSSLSQLYLRGWCGEISGSSFRQGGSVLALQQGRG